MPTDYKGTNRHTRNRGTGGVDAIPASVGAVSLSPPLTSNMTAWIAAHAITGKVDGDAISQWDDLSGNANHFTQATGGLQPLYKTNQKNGLAGVQFDSSNDRLTSPITGLGSTFSIYVVYACLAPGSNYRVMCGSNNWLIGPYAGTHRYFNGAFITGPTAYSGAYRMSAAVQDGTGATFYVDNTSIGSNANTTGPGTLNMGYVPGLNEPANSIVLEVVVYSVKHNSTNVGDMWAYFRTKYNL